MFRNEHLESSSLLRPLQVIYGDFPVGNRMVNEKEPCNFFGGEDSFKKLKIRDGLKNDFCLKNNIRLIRIAYDKSDGEIENILNNLLKPSMQV